MNVFRKIGIFLLLLICCSWIATVSAAEAVDTDGDGLNDNVEIALGTDINNPDTDSDEFSDAVEVANGYNPLKGGGDRSLARRAEVDISQQRLYYFLNNVKVGEMSISSGVRSWPTPTGDYKILRKLLTHRYTGVNYNYPNTKWNLEFKQGYFLHGAYWHNQFGIRPMSHGCVNIAYQDVEKLYKFMRVGDKVKIVGKIPTKKLTVAQSK